MNRLKTCFYENGISIVAQANNARNEAYRTTLAIQEFAAKANSAEVLYKHGEYTAEDYLKLAATDFDTNKIVTILHTYAEEEEKASAVNAATPEQPNQVNTANEDFDERALEIAEDEDLSDLDEIGDYTNALWPEETGNIDHILQSLNPYNKDEPFPFEASGPGPFKRDLTTC